MIPNSGMGLPNVGTVVEYTYFKIRRGQYEHVLRTLKDWREVMDYLAGKFSEQKDVGGPSLPPSTPS